MKRFIIIDEFGLPLRRFETMQEAKAFISNKQECKIVELTLDEILGDCLL